MRVLLPYCDIVSLRRLSITSKKWNDNVNIFLKDFNKVIQLDTTKIKIGKYFHFATHMSSKLVKLELNWNYGSHKECDYLHQVLENNKNLEEIDLTTTQNGWISTKIIMTMALELPKLKNVCFSSSRIKLFFGDESRKLWPHTCWNSKRINKENHSLNYSEEQVKIFRSQIQDRNSNKILGFPIEHQILCCLRLLHSKCQFSDFALLSDTSCELMEPLLYHEYKCPKGLFYNRDDDSDDSDIEDNYWNCSSPEGPPNFHWGGDSDTDQSDGGNDHCWVTGNIYS